MDNGQHWTRFLRSAEDLSCDLVPHCVLEMVLRYGFADDDPAAELKFMICLEHYEENKYITWYTHDALECG